MVSSCIATLWCTTQSQAQSRLEKKEELLLEIERQRDLGDSGLLDEDKYLAEVSLGDLETTSGEHQHFGLLAIKTAQKAKLLQEQQEQQQTGSGETR
jgi:hypothetical protein